ncbi:hypothetical protein B0T17DRAFT_603311 [Bombardia bombarda]|uniref:Uncharacterized protein n=1 Tax=Bombardia bombarda TaxID=252184 RepID=A0AA39U1V5_9PEZI|nr:hypothetical protein B0T17DRAFT_603311 [Bombardia bombarda]
MAPTTTNSSHFSFNPADLAVYCKPNGDHGKCAGGIIVLVLVVIIGILGLGFVFLNSCAPLGARWAAALIWKFSPKCDLILKDEETASHSLRLGGFKRGEVRLPLMVRWGKRGLGNCSHRLVGTAQNL